MFRRIKFDSRSEPCGTPAFTGINRVQIRLIIVYD